jgi:GT2 family glycosyltransferase
VTNRLRRAVKNVVEDVRDPDPPRHGGQEHHGPFAAGGLAVVVCTRERPGELAECLDSVRRSTLVSQIVVSTDGLDRETDELLCAEALRDERVEWIRGPRIGLAANRNCALGAVRQDYVMFLDDDARLDADFPSAVSEHVDPKTIVTGWEIRDGVKVTPRNPDFLGFQRLRPLGSLAGIVINATVFPSAFLRRTGFDESYQFGCEEADIAMAAISAGLRIVFVDAGNVHRHAPSSREGNDRLVSRSRAHFSV